MIVVKAYEDPPYNEDYYEPNVSDLSDSEIEYLALLLTICSIPLDKAINWLNSPEGLSSIETRTLKPGFFNNIDNEITTAVSSKYSSVSSLITNNYTDSKNVAFESMNRTPVSYLADKFTLGKLEQYNFDKIRNLTEEMKNSVRDTIWRGIYENKSLESITSEINQLGIEPLNGKSNAQARSASIARTELTRARLSGRLQAFAYYGVTKANIIAIGDGDECEDCLILIANNPWTLEELAKLIPVHPNCRHDQIEPAIEPTTEPIIDAEPIDVTININIGALI